MTRPSALPSRRRLLRLRLPHMLLLLLLLLLLHREGHLLVLLQLSVPVVVHTVLRVLRVLVLHRLVLLSL